MPAYVIAVIRSADHSPQVADYQRRLAPVVARFEGRYLTTGAQLEMLEGTPAPVRVVVIEFPSYEQAKVWYDSPAYKELHETRAGHMEIDMMIVNGV